jgi:hypothetical protein
MPDLDLMLKLAARADDWNRVVHRCAWCKRVVDERGEYGAAAAGAPAVVATDGMCPPCGKRALAQVNARRQRRRRLAA